MAPSMADFANCQVRAVSAVGESDVLNPFVRAADVSPEHGRTRQSGVASAGQVNRAGEPLLLLAEDVQHLYTAQSVRSSRHAFYRQSDHVSGFHSDSAVFGKVCAV